MQTQGASLLAANDAYDYEEGTGPAIARSALSSSYDLRDEGVVTPVKRQNPWSTCWGFAAISAAETSILSEMGTTYEEFPLDLSERQLAWFARTPLPDDAGSQAGEGMYSTNDDPNERLNVGGFPFVATSVFFSGVGPILEEQAPYRNNEGLTVMGHDGYTEYSTGGNWSLDESLRFDQPYELEASNILPSPVGTKLALDENGNFYTAYEHNEQGTIAIKSEFLEGRSVQIGFCADASRPGQDTEPMYINTDTWAHYTYDSQYANHAVAIVG